MTAAVVSPELALVDPELRVWALGQLPRLEPYDFLRLDDAPRRHPDLDRFDFLADYGEPDTFERPPPRLLAAAAYAATALARALIIDAVFVLGVAAAVAATQIFG